MSHSEQKFGRFKFLVLQGYQDKDGSRRKKRKIKFYCVCERITQCFYVSIQCPLFNPRFSMSDFYPAWLYIHTYIYYICIYIYIYIYLINIYTYIFCTYQFFFSFLFSFFYRTITTIKMGYPSLYLKLTYIVEMLDLF